MQLFASAQCTGYNMEKGKLTFEMCYPSEKLIIDEVNKLLFLFFFINFDSA